MKSRKIRSIILPHRVRTKVRTLLYNIADTYKKSQNQEVFEIEGEKYIFYPSTGTLVYPIPLCAPLSNMLVQAFKEGLRFPQIGTDESGKGDVFGPLVVAGAYVDKDDVPKLIEMGIKDSKRLGDDVIEEQIEYIKKSFLYDVVLIKPKKYNELYAKMKNVNRILAWAHARVIENILNKKEAHLVIIDMFANPDFIKSYMFSKGRTMDFIIESQGERYLSSALASIIARFYYIEHLKKMEKEYSMSFPKGAGSNVNKAILEFIKKYGKDKLPYVAKMHFKNIKAHMSGQHSL